MGTRTLNGAFREFLTTLTPTPPQVEAGARHRKSIKDHLESQFSVSRFFESGSFTHGTGVRYYSDTDVIVSLNIDQAASSAVTLEILRSSLARHFALTPVHADSPAVKVDFGGGFETWEVVPAFLRGVADSYGYPIYQIPSPSNGGWILSSPDSHLRYVNDANDRPEHGAAKALARLLKAWKYYNDVPISSFYLEMRAAEYMRRQSTFSPVLDMKYMLGSLDTNRLGDMYDPVGGTEWIKATSSSYHLESSLRKLDFAYSAAQRMVEAWLNSQEGVAFVWADAIFDKRFPNQHY